MKLSQILTQLLVEYTDRSLPLSVILKQVGNSGFGTIGLLEFDRLFILIGYGMTAATTIFFASIAGTIWQLVSHWWQILILKS